MDALQSSQGKTVLVVDDSVDSADALSTMLRLAGFDVYTAYSGQDALDLAEQAHPDALLLDIAMPDMNGYEVARRVREAKWGRAVSIIAVTSFDTSMHIRKSWEAGCDFHLAKPVDFDTVLALLTDRQAQS